MRILLFGKVIKETDHSFILNLIDELVKSGIQLSTTPNYYITLKESLLHKIDNGENIFSILNDTSPEIQSIDMVLSVGGDGTMLASALYVGETGIPILGINLGRMGFLASIDKDNCKNAIAQILNNDYTVEARSMLKLNSESNLFGSNPIALNDFTVQKKTSSSMITVHTYVNKEYFNSYWCNGLIVATPTGSTAFSMSCGGPIVMPDSKNIVLTAIAPHNLNIRPVILPDDVTIDFEIESRNEDLFCTMDSRFEVINYKEKLTINKNNYRTNLVKLNGHSYFTTLRNKLMWGKDVRNL